jgi:hypothetical protein
MWFWSKKRERAASDPNDAKADIEAAVAYNLVDSLRQAATEGGLQPEELFLSILFAPGDESHVGDRSDVLLGNGHQIVEWHVGALPPLFRGSRQPPPDSEMEQYPEQYVPFFYRVEYNVFRYCRTMDMQPTDAEFLEIYSQMRRLPDGKSKGPLHDVIWQSAALVLGLRPWSEAEYTAVFGQLARSARHFKMGPSSRNYIAYVRQTLEGR